VSRNEGFPGPDRRRQQLRARRHGCAPGRHDTRPDHGHGVHRRDLRGLPWWCSPQLLACVLASTAHLQDGLGVHERAATGAASAGKGPSSKKSSNSVRPGTSCAPTPPSCAPCPVRGRPSVCSRRRAPAVSRGRRFGRAPGRDRAAQHQGNLARRGSPTSSSLKTSCNRPDRCPPTRRSPPSTKAWFLDTGEVPVVENGPGARFLGVVTQRDLLGFLDARSCDATCCSPKCSVARRAREGVDYLELPEATARGSSTCPATSRADPGGRRSCAHATVSTSSP